MVKTFRTLALIVVLAMAAVACGQKEGVHQVGFAGGGGGGTNDGGFVDDGTGSGDGGYLADPGTVATDDGSGASPSGDVAGGGEADGATGGGSSPSGTGGQQQPTTQGNQQQNGNTGQQQQGEQQQQPQGGGDWTGISDDEIRIGLHAPLSGAAPLPQASFQTGRSQYWELVGEVHGRRVVVHVRDDQYNPSRATVVCNDLIQREKVYLLIGGGGTDQITACARTAAQQGVPYLSAGVDEGILRQLPNYYALSMSYLQQAPLLIQWVQKNSPPSNGRFGIVRDRTPGFNNVVNRVKEEAEKAGWEVLIRQTQAGVSDAQWLSQNSIEVAFPIMAPSQFVQIVTAPGGAIDQWAGIGITMGLNAVTSTICRGQPGYDGAMFFSPFPGLNQIDRLDPDFHRAGGEDDIQLALWGVNKSIHRVFQQLASNNLSRQAFMQALQSHVIKTNVYPELHHTPDDHFGAQSVHVLRADCSQQRNVTHDDGLFRSNF